VAMFNKRKTNGTEALERELAEASGRRDKLRERLAGARTALDRAISIRREALLNDTDDEGGGTEQIMTLGVEHDAIGDALAKSLTISFSLAASSITRSSAL
jgi:hypothetical protein